MSRSPPNAVDDTNFDFIASTVTLVPNTSTPVAFSADVRTFKVKHFSTLATLLVKSGAQGTISGASDAAASLHGIAPVANVPNIDWYPANCSNSLNLYSTVAAVVSVEAYF